MDELVRAINLHAEIINAIYVDGPAREVMRDSMGGTSYALFVRDEEDVSFFALVEYDERKLAIQVSYFTPFELELVVGVLSEGLKIKPSNPREVASVAKPSQKEGDAPTR